MQGQDRPPFRPRAEALSETPSSTRRSLLKGAALGAPAILTLRSGAVMAASSCTGYLVGQTYVDLDGGEHCVAPSNSNQCPSDKISDGQAVDPIAETETFFDEVSGEWIEQPTGRYLCPPNAVVMSSMAFMSLNLPATRG
ncbi:MAG: hypothetical protein JXM75_00315 [Chromatiaceae bacterium]|nr:hypothetical protein [Chromatiaceae bacterium]